MFTITWRKKVELEREGKQKQNEFNNEDDNHNFI